MSWAMDKARVAALSVRLRLRPRRVRVAAQALHECAVSKLWPTVDARQRAGDCVIATGLVESGLTVYANGNNPESLRLPHEAVGWDHGSVGFLQQQPGGAPNSTADWGTTRQCQETPSATRHFLRRLHTFDWTNSNGQLCQAVQGSAFPDRYAQRDADAIRIRRALWPYVGGTAPQIAPAKPTTRPVRVAPRKPGRVVVVRRDDDFGVIARREHVSRAALLAANPSAGHPAGHRDVIWPGDRLRLPG